MDIFSKYNLNINSEALNIMTQYSSGMPTMMQEIGYTYFWQNNDEYINEKNAILGVIESGKQYR